MTSKVAEEQFAITHMVRNEEIDDEELGLQIQPFNHGDPHPMKCLTSLAASEFQMQFQMQLFCSKYSTVSSIEAVETAWLFTTEMRNRLLKSRSARNEVVGAMRNLG
jgi:hypothetical protein